MFHIQKTMKANLKSLPANGCFRSEIETSRHQTNHNTILHKFHHFVTTEISSGISSSSPASTRTIQRQRLSFRRIRQPMLTLSPLVCRRDPLTVITKHQQQQRRSDGTLEEERRRIEGTRKQGSDGMLMLTTIQRMFL